MFRKFLLTASLALVPLASANAQGTASEAPVRDNMFAAAAASGGMAEVSISRIGLEKTTDPELKKFSQHMIDEHSKVNRELMALASRKQIKLPDTLDYRATFCGESLSGLSGEKFDECYAKAQLVAHMDALGAFEAEAERGSDPEIRAFAERTIPHIKEHLMTIKPIAMRYEKEKQASKGTSEHEK